MSHPRAARLLGRIKDYAKREVLALLIGLCLLSQPIVLVAQRAQNRVETATSKASAAKLTSKQIGPLNPDTGTGSVSLTTTGVAATENFDTLSNTAGTTTTTPCTVNVQGTTLETPPTQSAGGVFGSTLSVGTVTLGTPLANGASINLRFLVGLQQTGSFKFFINVEALP